MTDIIGGAMCNYCNFQIFKNCFELVQGSGERVVNMNDVCPKDRKIEKGHITFEEEEKND